MIAVVGGTGRLGGLVAQRLLGDGRQVRIISRHPPTDDVSPAQFVKADVRDPAVLDAAVRGAAVVVSAMHGMHPDGGESPAEVDRNGNRNLIAAARSTGAEIVLLSLIDARPDHPLELARMKAAAEHTLRSGPTDWTIVRASAYAEMWAEVIESTRGRNGVPKVFGRGANPINFVSVEDVATAVVRAVTDPTLRGHIIDVGGPENVTMTEFAKRVTQQSEVSHVPRFMLRGMGAVMALVRPGQARLIRSALLMDDVDLTFDPSRSRAEYPWLPRSESLNVTALRG